MPKGKEEPQKEKEEALALCEGLSANARLATVASLEARKLTRQAMATAYYDKGCSLSAIGRAIGVTRQRVKQVIEQEEMREALSDEEYDMLILSFPPAGLTSKQLRLWAASQDFEGNRNTKKLRST